MIERHIQAVIDFLETPAGHLDALFPDRKVFSVAGLEFHQFRFAYLKDGRIRVGGGIDIPIDTEKLGDRIVGERLMTEDRFPSMENHAELGAPVADMVIGDDMISEKAGDAGEGISDDSRAYVADVHRFGNIGRGEVNDYGAARAGERSAEAVITDEAFDAGSPCLPADAEIDEAGACDFGGSETGEVEGVDDLPGQDTGIGFVLFGKHHGRVRLVISKTEVGRSGNGGAGRRSENGKKRGGQAGFQFLDETHGDGELSGDGSGRRGGLVLSAKKIPSGVDASAMRWRMVELANILAMAASIRRWDW